jgi:hypothetical protein
MDEFLQVPEQQHQPQASLISAENITDVGIWQLIADISSDHEESEWTLELDLG